MGYRVGRKAEAAGRERDVMKGIVFSEFLEMVEKEFGYVVVDKITSLAALHGGGAYSSVGNYPHEDMLAMVGALSEAVGLEAGDLVRSFGRYLFRTFTVNNRIFFVGVDDALVFLNGIETVIHTEVRKLYDDAELPQFECRYASPESLVMDYKSRRPFADLAEGLILECIDYFGNGETLIREAGSTGDAHSARFVVTRSSSTAAR